MQADTIPFPVLDPGRLPLISSLAVAFASRAPRILSISADSDGSGSGSLLFASTSNITVDSSSYAAIDLSYGDVAWSSGFKLSAYNADVIFDKSTATSASFGGSGEVSSTELQMVTTAGVLQFGKTRVTDIAIQGMDRSSYSESLVLVKSAGAVTFDTGSTTIVNNLDVRSQGSTTIPRL